jgi:hypothetical protein
MSVNLHNKTGEIVQRFGGNKPVWPLQFGLSTSYRDNVTRSLKNADSFTGWALRWRVWMLDVDDANRLLDAASAEMERTRVGPPLRNGRHDAGPDFWRMHRFCTTTVAARAREVGVRKMWADSELATFLDLAGPLADIEGVGPMQRRQAPFQAYCRTLLSKEHALSRPRTKSTPRISTTPFGIGIKQQDYRTDEIAQQIEAVMARKKEKAA